MIPACLRCGEEMLPTGADGVFACRNAHVMDNGTSLGCECGYCMSRSPLARLHACLQETGLAAKGAKIPEEFIFGKPGHGEGI